MYIGNGYWLAWPAFPVEPEFRDQIVIFTVGGLLALRDQEHLDGHPIRDLPDEHKGWLPVTPAKRARIERWYEQARLLKIKRNSGGSYRITFWRENKYFGHLLADEDLHWLRMITEAANQFTDELLAERKRGLEVVTADPVEVKERNRKARRKERKQERMRERGANVH